MKDWTDARFRTVALSAFVALIVASVLLAWSDADLVRNKYPRSQELQRVSSAAVAACVVSEWGDRYKGPVTRGILIDTFVFIPSYVVLLAVCCFWCAKHMEDEQIHRAAVYLGYAAVIAGVFDLIENTGMLIELHAQRYGLAPVTAGASGLKWMLAAIIVIFLVGVWLQRGSLLRQDGMHGQSDGG
ncbi:MAG TPA: hypothetical protein VNN08_09795 [Thermoanaerobaculia bacterium]|nr:hypothetical protein [Thermoanaerobaculia bacterium]